MQESENQKLKVWNLEAQKQVLLQQLHPHFLFNALSTLKSLIKENPEMAAKLETAIRGKTDEVAEEMMVGSDAESDSDTDTDSAEI